MESDQPLVEEENPASFRVGCIGSEVKKSSRKEVDDTCKCRKGRCGCVFEKCRNLWNMSPKTDFVHRLEAGETQKLGLFGTSLSFHLAPNLRQSLQKKFGERAQIINLGLPGKASRTALEALESQVLPAVPDALLTEWAINDAHSYFHEPQALDAGITLQESRENLETLIQRVQAALPRSEILLMTTNPTFDAPGGAMRGRTARPLLEAFYEGVREVASARGLTLIDGEKFWNSLRLRDEALFRLLTPDGVHPTPRAWREQFVPFLEGALGISPEQP